MMKPKVFEEVGGVSHEWNLDSPIDGGWNLQEAKAECSVWHDCSSKSLSKNKPNIWSQPFQLMTDEIIGFADCT